MRKSKSERKVGGEEAVWNLMQKGKEEGNRKEEKEDDNKKKEEEGDSEEKEEDDSIKEKEEESREKCNWRQQWLLLLTCVEAKWWKQKQHWGVAQTPQ